MSTFNMLNETKDHCWNTVGVWGHDIPRCERLPEVTHCRNCEIFCLRGRDVFEKEIPEDYVVKWTEEYSAHDDEKKSPDNSVIIFRIIDEWFSLPTYCFDEITKILPIQRIPHYSGSLILGMTNVRGEIKLCFSLNHILGLAVNTSDDKKAEQDSSIKRRIVLQIEGDSFVFPVDEIVGVFRYETSELFDLPDTLYPNAADLAEGVLELPGKMVTCLEPCKLRDLIEGSLGG